VRTLRNAGYTGKSKKSIAISLMLALVLGTIHQIAYSRNKCESLYCPEDQVVLPGDYFKAISVAAKDFQQVMQQNVHNKKSELGLFLLDIKNYLILINVETDGDFLIHFYPKHFQDSSVKGGGATYKVNSVTFKLIEK
jgi:hypothetical protein